MKWCCSNRLPWWSLNLTRCCSTTWQQILINLADRQTLPLSTQHLKRWTNYFNPNSLTVRLFLTKVPKNCLTRWGKATRQMSTWTVTLKTLMILLCLKCPSSRRHPRWFNKSWKIKTHIKFLSNLLSRCTKIINRTIVNSDSTSPESMKSSLLTLCTTMRASKKESQWSRVSKRKRTWVSLSLHVTTAN